MAHPCVYSSVTPFLCNRWDAINDSVFTGRYEPIQCSVLIYIRRTAVSDAVDMACSVLIDLSFFVAKEGLYKEEPSVFGNRHEFFNSEPYIFRPCKKSHNWIMILILILILILMIMKYHKCIKILISILILMIIITSITRKYIKILLDSIWSIAGNCITLERIWESSAHLHQGCPLNLYGSHSVLFTIKHPTFVKSKTTQVCLIKFPSQEFFMFRPVLRSSSAVSTPEHLQEDAIGTVLTFPVWIFLKFRTKYIT
jgi:hypothetical protein